MTDYIFDQIDPAHPPLLTDSDRVIFHGGPARLSSVSFSLVNGQSVTTIDFMGHAVGFGPEIQLIAANGRLVFDDGSDLLIGGPRNESFETGPGDDALFGGDGSDTLIGGAGDNLLHGNQGDDVLVAREGANTVFGGQGNDIIRVGDGPVPGAINSALPGDFVHGNLGDDTIFGGNTADILLGGQGNDQIFGGAGADNLHGNLGNDVIVAGGLGGQVFGEAGADTLVAQARGIRLAGGEGADVFGIDVTSLGQAGGFGPGFVRVDTLVDDIVDWASEDSIHLANIRADHAYREIVSFEGIAPSDFESAFGVASQVIAAEPDDVRAAGSVIVVGVGVDLFVFVGSAGSSIVDYAIRIDGRGLGDVDAGDFI